MSWNLTGPTAHEWASSEARPLSSPHRKPPSAPPAAPYCESPSLPLLVLAVAVVCFLPLPVLAVAVVCSCRCCCLFLPLLLSVLAVAVVCSCRCCCLFLPLLLSVLAVAVVCFLPLPVLAVVCSCCHPERSEGPRYQPHYPYRPHLSTRAPLYRRPLCRSFKPPAPTVLPPPPPTGTTGSSYSDTQPSPAAGSPPR
jgi:hypothetical protein